MKLENAKSDTIALFCKGNIMTINYEASALDLVAKILQSKNNSSIFTFTSRKFLHSKLIPTKILF